MIEREEISKALIQRLDYFPSVAILGPRQVGKTTLAKQLANKLNKETEYLDLESSSDIARLQDPALYLKTKTDKLIIFDEVQRMPSLFPELRSLIDQHRVPGRFILLGSASPELLKNSSESLAGRISFVELMPFSFDEVGVNINEKNNVHWLRGGFPNAYLAPNPQLWEIWFEDFKRTYIERDLPMLGMPANPSETQRLLTMIAGMQGSLLNNNMLANSLDLSSKTVAKYIDFLENAFLVRRLLPYYINIGKRLTKSPKIYIRDSGFLHFLLGFSELDEIFGHTIAGNSWEGYVVQEVFQHLPPNYFAYFYRTQDGAELDIIIERGGKIILGIEIKLSDSPRLTKGNTVALKDLGNPALLIVTPSADDYPIGKGQFVCSIKTLSQNLKKYF